MEAPPLVRARFREGMGEKSIRGYGGTEGNNVAWIGGVFPMDEGRFAKVPKGRQA
jgi:hypothetical protein